MLRTGVESTGVAVPHVVQTRSGVLVDVFVLGRTKVAAVRILEVK